jgi:hypothetical protein
MAGRRKNTRNVGKIERIEKMTTDRLSGMTTRQIARKYDMPDSRVSAFLTSHYADVAVQVQKNLNEIRGLQIARLEALFVTHWRTRANAKSADICLKIHHALASMHGLDAPMKFQDVPPSNLANTLDLSRMTDEHLAMLELLITLYGPGSDSSVVATQEKPDATTALTTTRRTP